MSFFSYEDLLEQRYAEYMDPRNCVCEQNDDCCCLSLAQFEDEWIKKYEESQQELMEDYA